MTREALVVHSPGERDLLLVNFYNHVPNARRMATRAQVDWAGENPIETAIAELRRRGASEATTVAAIGPFAHGAFERLAEFARPVDLNATYDAAPGEVGRGGRVDPNRGRDDRRRRRGGAGPLRPGTTEAELADAAERAYVARGGTTHIHYFGATSMTEPGVCVPAQWPSTRAAHRGLAQL